MKVSCVENLGINTLKIRNGQSEKLYVFLIEVLYLCLGYRTLRLQGMQHHLTSQRMLEIKVGLMLMILNG